MSNSLVFAGILQGAVFMQSLEHCPGLFSADHRVLSSVFPPQDKKGTMLYCS